MDELTDLREYAEDTRDDWPGYECQIAPDTLLALLDVAEASESLYGLVHRSDIITSADELPAHWSVLRRALQVLDEQRVDD